MFFLLNFYIICKFAPVIFIVILTIEQIVKLETILNEFIEDL